MTLAVTMTLLKTLKQKEKEEKSTYKHTKETLHVSVIFFFKMSAYISGLYFLDPRCSKMFNCLILFVNH